MARFTGAIAFPLKLTIFCVLILVDLFLIVLLVNYVSAADIPASIQNAQLFPNERPPDTKSSKEKKQSMQAIDAAVKTTAKGIEKTLASGITQIGTAADSVVSAVENAANSTGNAVGAAARTVGDTTNSMVKSIATTVTQPETIIKPEPSYEVPQIAAVAQPDEPAPTPSPPPQVVPAANAPTLEPSPSVIWPLEGRVTTEFGTYHRPYQPIHTGIDISSPLVLGGAPVTTFKEGVVAEVIYSRSGLGNHIIVDHGGGLTSCYAHLSSITAKTGQIVKPGNIIGHEGSTGTSTGPHLHFEIRQNNQPQNPRKFIPNNP